MKWRFGALAVAAALALGPAAAATAGDSTVVRTTMSFDDVRQALSDAIVNRGYVIDHVSHISDMLKRTAQAVGATRDIYIHAETMQFCSAVLSRRMMAADAANIAYCPFAIFIYEPAGEAGTVYAGYRALGPAANPASQAVLNDINALLDDIVHEATAAP